MDPHFLVNIDILRFDPGRPAAGVARNIDRGEIKQADLLTGDLNQTAGLSGIVAGSIQKSCYIHHAQIAARQNDFTVLLCHRLRFNDSTVVDHTADHVPGILGGHQHPAAMGTNQAGVVDPVFHHLTVLIQHHTAHRVRHHKIDQPVTQEIHHRRLARSQGHRSQIRHHDGTPVFHTRRQQSHITRRRNQSFIDDKG